MRTEDSASVAAAMQPQKHHAAKLCHTDSPLSDSQEAFFRGCFQVNDSDQRVDDVVSSLRRFLECLFDLTPAAWVYVLENYLIFPLLQPHSKLLVGLAKSGEWQEPLILLLVEAMRVHGNQQQFPFPRGETKTNSAPGLDRAAEPTNSMLDISQLFRLMIVALSSVHVYQFSHLKHGLEKPLLRTLDQLEFHMGWHKPVVDIARLLLNAVLKKLGRNIIQWKHEVSRLEWTNLIEFFYVIQEFICNRPVRPMGYKRSSERNFLFHGVQHDTRLNEDSPLVTAILHLLKHELKVESIYTGHSFGKKTQARALKIKKRCKLALDSFTHLQDFWVAVADTKQDEAEIQMTSQCLISCLEKRKQSVSSKKMRHALELYARNNNARGRILAQIGVLSSELMARPSERRQFKVRQHSDLDLLNPADLPLVTAPEEEEELDTEEGIPVRASSEPLVVTVSEDTLTRDLPPMRRRHTTDVSVIKASGVLAKKDRGRRRDTIWAPHNQKSLLRDGPLSTVAEDDSTEEQDTDDTFADLDSSNHSNSSVSRRPPPPPKTHHLPSDVFTAYVSPQDVLGLLGESKQSTEEVKVVFVEIVIPNLDALSPVELQLDPDTGTMLIHIDIQQTRPEGPIPFNSPTYHVRQSRVGPVEKWIVLPRCASLTGDPRVYVSPHVLTVVFPYSVPPPPPAPRRRATATERPTPVSPLTVSPPVATAMSAQRRPAPPPPKPNNVAVVAIVEEVVAPAIVVVTPADAATVIASKQAAAVVEQASKPGISIVVAPPAAVSDRKTVPSADLDDEVTAQSLSTLGISPALLSTLSPGRVVNTGIKRSIMYNSGLAPGGRLQTRGKSIMFRKSILLPAAEAQSPVLETVVTLAPSEVGVDDTSSDEDSDLESEPTEVTELTVTQLLAQLFPNKQVARWGQIFAEQGYGTVSTLVESDGWQALRETHGIPSKIFARLRASLSART